MLHKYAEVSVLTKAEIIAALPSLSRADLATVQAAANHLLGATGALQPGADTPGPILFSALVTAAGHAMPYSAMPTDTARRFNNAVPGLVKFLDSHFSKWCDNKVSQIAFTRMLFGLLVADLKGRGVNPSVGVMIVNMGRIPEVIENAFPNYLKSGLGDIIWNQHGRGAL